MISAAGIPVIEGDMDALAAHARALSTTGSAFADTGARVNATWQGLAGVYDAPEVAQLLTATAPFSRRQSPVTTTGPTTTPTSSATTSSSRL